MLGCNWHTVNHIFKINNLISFGVCTYPWNHYHNQKNGYIPKVPSFLLEIPPALLFPPPSYLPPPPPPAPATLSLQSVGNTDLFSVTLVSFTYIFLSFFQTRIWGKIPFRGEKIEFLKKRLNKNIWLFILKHRLDSTQNLIT